MIYFIGGLLIIAYIFQMVLGIKQFKYFNRHYVAMRNRGQVVIGTNKGRIVSGTIILLVVDKQFKIVEAEKMQGVSSFATFKSFDQVVGCNLLELDADHPALVKENKLTKKAIIQASESCVQPISQAQEHYRPMYSLENLQLLIKSQLLLYKKKIRKS